MSTTAKQLESELSAYQEILGDPRLKALTARTLAWAWQIGLFEPPPGQYREGTKLVVVASVYAHLCRPKSPTDRQLDIAARFCLLFFCIDDAEPEELASLTTSSQLWDVGPLTPYMSQWLAEYEEFSHAPKALKGDFTKGFHDYLRFRRDEPTRRSHKLTIAEHWSFRRQTVFIDPYVDLWIISMRLDSSRIAHEALNACRKLVVDLVLLSNDLGSLERDRDGAAAEHDLNLVHTYAREEGRSEMAAVEHLIATHNHLAAEFRSILVRAVHDTDTQETRIFGDLLCRIVDGNRAALTALHFRYPGIAELVLRLDTVTEQVKI